MAGGITRDLLLNDPEPYDQAFLSWNMDWSSAGNVTALPTAGVEYLMRFDLQETELVSRVCSCVKVGGTVLTVGQCFSGLRDSTGKLLSSTADVSTAMGTPGLMNPMLVNPQLCVGANHYYVSLLFNGTMGPAMLAGAAQVAGGISVGNMGLASAADGRFLAYGSGQTALAPQINLAAASMNVPATWTIAVS